MRIAAFSIATAFMLVPVAAFSAVAFIAGDPVRATKSEMLVFEGKNFARAAKGQEFTLLKHDPVKKQVFVSFLKDDGAHIALALPEEVVEPAVPKATQDLVRAAEAFRDQQFPEMKRLFTRAAQDKQLATLAGALLARANGAANAVAQARTKPAAKQSAAAALQNLRETAEQLAKAAMPGIALPLDEGADKLGAQVPGLAVPPTKLDRADIAKRLAVSQRAFILARQEVAAKRLVAAARHIKEGLGAEPSHPELKEMLPKVEKDIGDAEDLCSTAKKVRRFEKGDVHALSAIDDGLKLCADHAELRKLRKELSAKFEERTSPQVTPAFLSMAKASTQPQVLAEGRRLYTTRCSECHDLEMLDGRTLSGWERMVSGMSRRAGLNEAEKARIMDYIAAAQKFIEADSAK